MGGNGNNKRLRKRKRKRHYWEEEPRKPWAVWLAWGLPTAGLAIAAELFYLLYLAEEQGGSSVLGVLVAGACAAAAVNTALLHDLVHNEFDDMGGNPFVVSLVVSAAVAALFVPVQLIFFN
ncbi:hypothetical protein AB0I81_55175 [Nonomuraea sp. NPDC050404]|uniref:hypothetical protein n=1 Tax=Nonomuraea sp. NPDC050404 TaxID=3155783 RepID=UPI003403323A